MTRLYGIKNCDTVKKARKWLEANDYAYEFHDFRSDGINEKLLRRWLQKIEASQLINRRSTTWKQLSDVDKALFDKDTLSAAALSIVIENPTLIKRPVLEAGANHLVGFSENEYRNLLN